MGGLAREVAGKSARATVQTGHGAAVALIKMMRGTISTFPPMDVVDAFNAASGRERVPHMWDELGARTITCIANAALFLATLWESAWVEGGGNATGAQAIPNTALVAIDTARLRDLYMDADFIRSFTLPQLEAGNVLA